MFRAAGADPARIAFQPYRLTNSGALSGHGGCYAVEPARSWAAGFLLCCLAAPLGVFAQSPAPAQDKPATTAETPKTAPATQKIPRVTTTIEVHADVKNDYIPIGVDFGSLDGAFVMAKDVPLSVTVATKALLNDQMARVLSDVVKNDASIGEDYAPVGYYGDFSDSRLPYRSGFGNPNQRHDRCRRAGCAAGKQGARGIRQGHCRAWRAAWPRRAA